MPAFKVRITEAAGEIAKLYEATGQLEKAHEWRATVKIEAAHDRPHKVGRAAHENVFTPAPTR